MPSLLLHIAGKALVSDQAGDAIVTLSYWGNHMAVTAHYVPVQHLQFSKASFQLHGSAFWPLKAAWKKIDDPWYRCLNGVHEVRFTLDHIASDLHCQHYMV